MSGHPRSVLTCAAIAAVVLAAPAYADKGHHGGHHGDPRGNNGTVKVDGEPFDDGHGNEPHVGCVFRLKFYGFDADQHADITFAAHAPSGSGVLQHQGDVLISDDAAGGGKDLDAVLTYDASTWDLSGLQANSNQGYHVKLSVDVAEAPGGAKQKVFWIDCAPTATTSTGGTGTATGAGGTGTTTRTGTGAGGTSARLRGGHTGTRTVTGSAAGVGVLRGAQKVVAAKPATTPEVLGTKILRSGGAGAFLPMTGSPTTTMVLVSLALLAVGGLLLWAVAFAARRAARTP